MNVVFTNPTEQIPHTLPWSKMLNAGLLLATKFVLFLFFFFAVLYFYFYLCKRSKCFFHCKLLERSLCIPVAISMHVFKFYCPVHKYPRYGPGTCFSFTRQQPSMRKPTELWMPVVQGVAGAGGRASALYKGNGSRSI